MKTEYTHERVTLSIVIACYNCERTLEACVASIGDQRGVQTVLVNDASTDSTAEIINSLRDAYDKLEITVVDNKRNSGPGPTRNNGIEVAHNDYILFLDSDDRLSDGACNEIISILEDKRPDILVFDAYIERKNSLRPLKMFVAPDIHEGYVSNHEALLYGRGCTCGKAYARQLIVGNSIRYLNIPRSEDVPFAKTAFALAEEIWYTESPLYLYLENASSIMHDESALNAENPSLVYETIRKQVDDRGMQKELECLFYVLVVYPVMITMIRQGASSTQCSDRWRNMTKEHSFRGAYYRRLEAKYRVGYWLFRLRVFWVVKWMLKNA